MRSPLSLVREDLAWSLWREGYDAIPRRWGSAANATTARMLGRRTVLLRGPAGVRLFYDPAVVSREHAVPRPLADLLFGRGAVHGLDGEQHQERKAMFLHLLDDSWTQEVTAEVSRQLDEVVPRWTGTKVRVFDELVGVYGRSVLRVAGVEVPRPVADRLARHLAAIVDGFGFAGAAYPRAVLQRARLDRWASGLVRDVRHGRVVPPPGTVLHRIALAEGAGLSAQVAGVELLNVLRPTVAVAWLGTFAVRDLALRPELAARLRESQERHDHVAFGHEVRRLAPFVPALTGLARRDALIDQVAIRAGDRVLLDVPGTNADPAVYADPERFCPERFGREPDAWSFVPQGGGEVDHGHRCPGEPTTVALLAETVRAACVLPLGRVEEGRVDRSRMPALPERGLLIRVPALPS